MVLGTSARGHQINPQVHKNYNFCLYFSPEWAPVSCTWHWLGTCCIARLFIAVEITLSVMCCSITNWMLCNLSHLCMILIRTQMYKIKLQLVRGLLLPSCTLSTHHTNRSALYACTFRGNAGVFVFIADCGICLWHCITKVLAIKSCPQAFV